MKKIIPVLIIILGLGIWIGMLYGQLSKSSTQLVKEEEKYKNLEDWIKQNRWIPTSGISLSFPPEMKVTSIWIYKDVILVTPASMSKGPQFPYSYELGGPSNSDYRFEGKTGWLGSDGAYSIPVPEDCPQELSLTIR